MTDARGGSPPADAPSTRTFLIADIRGYTTYTREHGDERAAGLATRFAEIVRDVVAAHDGTLVELRGDEALVMFVSARRALRAAVELQAQFDAAGLERGVGIGLDAGEAVPIEGGYRGSALNLAARLCAQAGPGQIIASEGVIHLAATVEGIRYVDARSLRLKGYDQPVRAVTVVSASAASAARRRRGGWSLRSRTTLALAAVGLSIVLIASVAASGLLTGAPGSVPSLPAGATGTPSRRPSQAGALTPSLTQPSPSQSAVPKIQTPGVAVVDLATGSIVGAADVHGPTEFAAFANGSFWDVASALNRIDPQTMAVSDLPVSVSYPNGFVVVDSVAWVVDADTPHVVGIDLRTGSQAHVWSLNADANDDAPGRGIAYADGALWVARPDIGEIVRLDPDTGNVIARIEGSGGAISVAAGDGGIWSGGAYAPLHRIDPATNTFTATATLSSGWIRDLLVAGGYAWAAGLEQDVVYKVDSSGRIVNTLATGRRPQDLTSDDQAVYVANYGSDTVTRIDMATGATNDIKLGYAPFGLAVGDGRLLVAFDQTVQSFVADQHLSGKILTVSAHRDPFQSNAPDPPVGWSEIFRQAEQATCAPLLTYPPASDPNPFQLRPEVAAGMPDVSADGLTYTFTVRPGWRFSPPDNSELTAETYKFSLERALSPGLGGNGAGQYYLSDIAGASDYIDGTADHVSGIVADGDKLSITLTAPAGDFLERLSMPFFCPVPIGTPVEDGGIFPDPPLASAGPYYIKAQIYESVYLLVRNPNYGGPQREGYDAFVYEVGFGPNDVLQDVETGAAGAGVAYPDAQALGPASTIAATDQQAWFGAARFGSYVLQLNPADPLLKDVSVRQAISIALDRTTIAGAFNAAPTDQIVPPAYLGAAQAAPAPARDVQAAGQLMAGRTGHVVLAVADWCADCQAAAQTIVANLSEIGITVEVRLSGTPVRDAQARKSDISMLIEEPSNDWPDPLSLLSGLQPSSWLPADLVGALDDAVAEAAADRATAAMQVADSSPKPGRSPGVWLSGLPDGRRPKRRVRGDPAGARCGGSALALPPAVVFRVPGGGS